MIRYLHRLKSKKGFTMVELVIVIAIIGIIGAAMITNMLNASTEKQLAANTNAEVFMTASQLAFTRMQFTERQLVTVIEEEDKYITYVNGLNQIQADTYLFVEAKSGETGFEYIHLAQTLPALASMAESKPMTNLEQYVAERLEVNITESYDGYFYAVVDEDFRVLTTAYSDGRLPTPTGGGESYRDQIEYTAEGKIDNVTVGICTDGAFFGAPGEYALNAPKADADSSEITKFFG